MGYGRNQHHDRRISSIQSGTILVPQTTMYKHLPLRSLWGPKYSNQIFISKKTKNAPPDIKGEEHIMNEALYKKR